MSRVVEVEVPGSGRIIEVHVAGVQGPAGDLPEGTLLAENNLSDVDDAAESRTNLDLYSTAEVDAAIAASVTTDTDTGTNTVTGLGVTYSGTALTFNMSAGTARINGELVTGIAQSLTLSAADATNPRIDTFYLDDAGLFGAITGTAAVNPSQPAVDPLSQLYLGFALVPATATDLTTGTTTETIYDEGVEWTASVSGSGFAVDSLVNPQSGTKCIQATLLASGDYVKFVDGSPTGFEPNGTLTFFIQSKAAWPGRRSIQLRWHNAGQAIGQAVTIKDGSFGFNSSNIVSYQQLVINKSLFAVAAGAACDELRITAAGSGGTALGFYLDSLKSQNIAASQGGTTVIGLSQDVADARYLRLTGGTLSGDLSVPDEAYDATAWNGSLKVPTKNAVRDAIVAVVAGVPSSFTTEDAQDAVGAMVDSSLTYVDATPLLQRAALTGHITAAAGSNSTALGSFTKAQLDTAVSDGNVLYVGDAYAPGGTDVAVADGGTGASTAAAARTNLDVYSKGEVDTAIAGVGGSGTDLFAAGKTFRAAYGKFNSTTHSEQGIALTATGTNVLTNFANTSFLTTLSRSSRSTGTTAEAYAGWRDADLAVCRRSGFKLQILFAVSSIAGVDTRVFAGLTSDSLLNTDEDPVNFDHILGFAMDAADANWQRMESAGTTGATKTDTGIALAAGEVLEATIECAAGGTSAIMTLKRWTGTSATVATTYGPETVSAALPADNQSLFPYLWINNNGTAAASVIDLVSMKLLA